MKIKIDPFDLPRDCIVRNNFSLSLSIFDMPTSMDMYIELGWATIWFHYPSRVSRNEIQVVGDDFYEMHVHDGGRIEMIAFDLNNLGDVLDCLDYRFNDENGSMISRLSARLMSHLLRGNVFKSTPNDGQWRIEMPEQ